MKILRVFLALFLLAVCSSFAMINAEVVPGWAPVRLGSYSSIYTSGSYMKTEYGNQYIKTRKAVDNFTGAEDRAVEARTLNASLADVPKSDWISTGYGTYETWSGSRANGNYQPNFNYQIQLRASRSTLATVDYHGQWFLNPSSID